MLGEVVHLVIPVVKLLVLIIFGPVFVPKEVGRRIGFPGRVSAVEGVGESVQPVGPVRVGPGVVDVLPGQRDPPAFSLVVRQGRGHRIPRVVGLVVASDHPEDGRVIGRLSDQRQQVRGAEPRGGQRGNVHEAVGHGTRGESGLEEGHRTEHPREPVEEGQTPAREEVAQEELSGLGEVTAESAVARLLGGRGVEGHVVGLRVFLDVDDLHALAVLDVVGAHAGPGALLVVGVDGASGSRGVFHLHRQVELRVFFARNVGQSLDLLVNRDQEEVHSGVRALQAHVGRQHFVLGTRGRDVVCTIVQTVEGGRAPGSRFGGEVHLVLGEVPVQVDFLVDLLSGQGVEGLDGDAALLDVVFRLAEAVLVVHDVSGAPLAVLGQQGHDRQVSRGGPRVHLLGGGDGHLGVVGHIYSVFVRGFDVYRVGDARVGVHLEGDLTLLGDDRVPQVLLVFVEQLGPKPDFGESVDPGRPVPVLDDQGDHEGPLFLARQVVSDRAVRAALLCPRHPRSVETFSVPSHQGGVRVFVRLESVFVQEGGVRLLVLEEGIGLAHLPVQTPLGFPESLIDFLLRALEQIKVVVRVQVVEEGQSLVGPQIGLVHFAKFSVLHEDGQSPVLVVVSGELEGGQGRVPDAIRRRRLGHFGHLFADWRELVVDALLPVDVGKGVRLAVPENEVQPEGQRKEGHQSDDGQVEDVRLFGLVVISEQKQVHHGQHGQEKDHEARQQEHHEVLPVEESTRVAVTFLVESQGVGTGRFPFGGQVGASAGRRGVHVFGELAEFGDIVQVGFPENLAAFVPHLGREVLPKVPAVLGPENGADHCSNEDEEQEHIEEELGSQKSEQQVEESEHDHYDCQDKEGEEDFLVGQPGLVGVLGHPPLDILVVDDHSEGEAEGSQGREEEGGEGQVVLPDGHRVDVPGEDEHAEPDDQGKGGQHDQLVLLLLPLGVEVLAPLAAPVVRVGLHFPHVGLVEGHVHEHRHPGRQEEDQHQDTQHENGQLGDCRWMVLGVDGSLLVVRETPEGAKGEDKNGESRDDREGQEPGVLPVVEEDPGHHCADEGEQAGQARGCQGQQPVAAHRLLGVGRVVVEEVLVVVVVAGFIHRVVVVVHLL